MHSRLAIPLPPLATPLATIVEGTFPTTSLCGPYGITAEVEGFARVLDWQDQKALPFQGYYRLIHHPLLKNILARLRALYGLPCALPYTTAACALKELLEYLALTGPLDLDLSRAGGPERLVAALAGAGPHPGGRPVRLRRFPAPPWSGNRIGPAAPLEPFAGVDIVCHDQPPAAADALDGADYAVVNLAPADSPARMAVLLTRRVAEGADLHERNRRRGYSVAARDADWLGGGTPDVTPAPGAEERVLGELCAWENAAGGVLYPTGMNALVEVFHALCPPGRRRAVVVGHLYSDTHLLLTDLPWAGGSFQTTFLRGDEARRVADALTPDTGMVFVETITNPLAEVPDLPLIAAACRARGVPLVVDNTMASPFNCKPLDWGADVSVHSTTKYFAGANDHGGGFVAVRDPALLALLQQRQTLLGNRMSAFEATVLERRLGSFAERMPRFNANGLAVARFLRAHPAVDRVWYAGLEDSPFRAEADKLLRGGASVVSCTVRGGDREAMRRFYDTPTPAVRKAPSLGSDTTLFCPYVMLTYYKRDDVYLEQYRLPRYLLRFAVGCETDLAPVLADLDRALRAAAGL